MTTRRTSTPTYRPRFLDSPVEVAALMAELRALADSIDSGGGVGTTGLEEARAARLLQWHAELSPLGQLSTARRSVTAEMATETAEDWTRNGVAR